MLGLAKDEGSAVSAEFQHALMQQVLRTELIRIKALIGTTALLAVMILILHMLDPYAVEHLWHGRLRPTRPLRDPDPLHPVRTLGPYQSSAGI